MTNEALAKNLEMKMEWTKDYMKEILSNLASDAEKRIGSLNCENVGYAADSLESMAQDFAAANRIISKLRGEFEAYRTAYLMLNSKGE